MPDDTPNLVLPLIQPAQAQKHVTHNEALAMLDALVQLRVADLYATEAPADPAEGLVLGIGAQAQGAFAGRDGQIAYFSNGGWLYLTPREGMRAWNDTSGTLHVRQGNTWIRFVPDLNDLEGVGVNAGSDPVNRLSVSAPATLLSHEGDDHRLKINKAAPGDTASLLYQTGFSGRAEMGLAGDDDFAVKVSADGAAWSTALAADAATGAVRFPNGQREPKTGLAVPTYLPAPVRDIFRINGAPSATPRGYAISGVSGANVSVAPSAVSNIYPANLAGVSMVRVWNVSKSPARPGWIVASNESAGTLSLRNGAETAGWAAGETLQLGDPNPTAGNTMGMIAVDISPYLQTHFGTVPAQKGIDLYLAEGASSGSTGLNTSGSGASGTLLGTRSPLANVPGTLCVPVPTFVRSPVSNANLIFFSQSIGGSDASAFSLARPVGIYL